MTREYAKQLGEAMIAWAEGKEVQVKSNDKWEDYSSDRAHPNFNNENW